MTTKKELAQKRNWELFQVAGMESNIRGFQFKYPMHSKELRECLYALNDLRTTIMNSYKEKGLKK